MVVGGSLTSESVMIEYNPGYDRDLPLEHGETFVYHRLHEHCSVYFSAKHRELFELRGDSTEGPTPTLQMYLQQ